MKIIQLKEQPINYKDFIKRSAKEGDYTELIDESCVGVFNGEVKFIYEELDIDTADVVQAIRNIKYNTTERVGGLTSTSRIFGFRPRNVRRADFCSAASLAVDFPKEHDTVCGLANKLEEHYKKLYPDGWEKHRKETDERVLPNYKIKDSVFTSGIINKNNPLNYHFDAGNFKKVYSCMVVFKNKVEGGYLSIPEYGIAVRLNHNSLFMFDGQSIMHGVTPIKYSDPAGYRYSIVYYSLDQIWQCMEIDDELARIRNLKTVRERKRINVTEEYKQQFRDRYYKNKKPKHENTIGDTK